MIPAFGSRMKIGIYGGSFNPVHAGHLRVARAAVEALGLDRLIVIPANVSPFKTGPKTYSPPWDRLALVRHAFAEMPRVMVDEREIRRGGVSYAIDTVREIAAENPGAELCFIVGEDSLAGLPRWKESAALQRLCSFKVFPRTPESSTAVRELFERTGVARTEQWTATPPRAGVCPCAKFLAQLADPAFHGRCACRLYRKP